MVDSRFPFLPKCKSLTKQVRRKLSCFRTDVPEWADLIPGKNVYDRSTKELVIPFIVDLIATNSKVTLFPELLATVQGNYEYS
jgi:hypothetical protein